MTATSWAAMTRGYNRRPGGVPERPKGTGCKPVGSAYGGSNPPAPMFGLVSVPQRSARTPRPRGYRNARDAGEGAARPGDLMPDRQLCREGWKHLHDIQLEVRGEKEVYLLQRALVVVLLPDVEQRPSHANASVDQRAVPPRLPRQACPPQ